MTRNGWSRRPKRCRRGSDYIVIGRPIRDADDPARAAEQVALEIETGLSGDPGE